jgi:diketogulonate reductase-like aldo/keto reductase
VRAFERLQEEGKIRSWGVSNFDVDELEELLAIAGPGQVACNQVLYHLRERYIEHRVLPWCERHGVAVVGYSPFGSGDFPEPGSPDGRVLAEVARAHGVTPRQVALSFLTRRRSVFAIPKASREAHTRDNAAAERLRLSEEEVARLEEAFDSRGEQRSLPVV